MINVVLKPKKEIQVSLKPEQGIQIEATKKYLFDPATVQEYVDASAENAEITINKTAETQQIFDDTVLFADNVKSDLVAYTNNAKKDITNTVSQGEESVQEYVESSKQEIQEIARTAAEDAVQNAADEATRIATEQTNIYVANTIEPKLQEYVSNAEADASNASESAGHASESASDASHYAEDARIWAEGEQAEVKELGGELSSMGAADLAYAIANAPEDTPIDTSNLFALNIFKGDKGDRGEKGRDGLDERITNCITEIPQDIKVEINSDGKAVVKAGSKCYFPNGTGKFDVYTVPSDLLYNFATQTGLYFLAIGSSGGAGWATVANAASGTSTEATVSFYYRTDENKIRYKNDTSDTKYYSFPLAIVDIVKGVGTIRQVFNGFGYIGSTVFALPGVKGLIPNGRNADGSLKNTEFTTNSVSTLEVSGTYKDYLLEMANTAKLFDIVRFRLYDEQTNYNKSSQGGNIGITPVGKISVSNGVINSFTPKTTFHAVDYNEYKPEIDSKVKKTGDTMTGDLYITKNNTTTFHAKCTDFDCTTTTAPEGDILTGRFLFRDKNNAFIGGMENRFTTAGNVETYMSVQRIIDGANKTAIARVRVTNTGDARFEFPRCTAKATTTSSAASDKVAVVVQNYKNGNNWYRVWSDGWIEQGGIVSKTARTQTINLNKAFTANTYTLLLSPETGYDFNNAAANTYSISSKTTTTFSIASYFTETNQKTGWYACGY